MTILLAILSIVFFSGNSFLIGKVFRRWNITINTYLCNVLGFIALMGILYIFFMFLYISGATGFVYIGFICGIQISLIAIYAWNWKYILISKIFNKKAIVCFAVITLIGLLFLTAYHEGIYRNNNSSEFNDLFDRFIAITKLDQTIYFDSSNETSKMFSVFTLTSLTFKNMLFIENKNNIKLFLIWGNDFNLLFISASLITSFVVVQKQWKYIFYSWAFAFAYFIIIFLINDTSILGTTWIGVFVIAFTKILFKREFVLDHFQWNNLMVMFLFAAPGIHIDLSMAAIIMGTLYLYNSGRIQANGLSAFAVGIFPMLTIILSWIPLVSWIDPQHTLTHLLPFSICAILSIIFITITNLTKNGERLRKGNIIVQKRIYLIFALASILYLVQLSFLTITIFNYKISFDIIMIKQVWLVNIAENWKIIFNVFIWLIYLTIFIFLLFLFIRQKQKINWEIPGMLLIFVFWINPLACTAYDQIRISIPDFNYGVVNTLLIIFMGTTLFNKVINNKEMLAKQIQFKKELTDGKHS